MNIWESYANVYMELGSVTPKMSFISCIEGMKQGKTYTNGEHYYRITDEVFHFGYTDEDLIEWERDGRELHDLIISNIEVWECKTNKDDKSNKFNTLVKDIDGLLCSHEISDSTKKLLRESFKELLNAYK